MSFLVNDKSLSVVEFNVNVARETILCAASKCAGDENA
jgi:hypothetical protein